VRPLSAASRPELPARAPRSLRAGLCRWLVAVVCGLGCDAHPPRTPNANEASAGPAPGGGAPDVCAGAAGLAAGLSEQKITSGGVERRFLVLVPARLAQGERVSVVFNLHGSGGSPEGQLATSALAPLAEAEPFVMVAPAALNARWNVPPVSESPDDVRFIGDIIDALPRLACIDSRRVYATGFSGGDGAETL
jgi:hypothetical protein